MARKKSNFVLVIVFAVLLMVVFADVTLFSGKSERTIDKSVFKVDTSLVDKVTMRTKADNFKEVTLYKNDSGWHVKNDKFDLPAEEAPVVQIFEQLANMKVLRLAATNREKWNDYMVEDSGSTQLELWSRDKTLMKLVIGKFSFQENQKALTYIRLADQEETYAVDGFLAVLFSQGVNGYRRGRFTPETSDDWTAVNVEMPGDSGFVLNRTGDTWSADSELDSTTIHAYINRITNLKTMSFAAGFKPGRKADYRIEIMRTDKPNVIVSAFQVATDDYVLQSSLNPENYLADDGGQFDKLFAARSMAKPRLKK